MRLKVLLLFFFMFLIWLFSKDMGSRKVRREVLSAHFAHASYASLKKRILLTSGQFKVTFVTCTACDSWRLSYCTDVTH